MDGDMVAAYARVCAEVLVGTSVKVGHCPPAFMLFSRSGELHYGCMQLYDPEPQSMRMWIVAAKCDIGFVFGSVHAMAYPNLETLEYYQRNRPIVDPMARLYMRCELSPRVRPTKRVSEVIVHPSGDPEQAIQALSAPSFADVWCPGYFGPKDMPPIYKSAEPDPRTIRRQSLRPILSILSDTGAERESVFLETVDEVLRKQIGLQGMT